MTFAEELEGEVENQGSESQISKFEHPDSSAKDQADSKLKTIASSGTSGLEGCLEIPTSSGGFDDNLVITFSAPILHSPEARTLDFMEKDKTPQSRPPKDAEPEDSLTAGQGQHSKQS